MKQLYFVIFLLFSYTAAFSANKYAPPLSATITGTTTVCQNTSGVVITFTAIGGTAPFTFTYTVMGITGNQTISTIGSSNSITLAVPTGTSGTFTYSLASVEDSSVGHAPVNSSGSAQIIVTPQPDATINGTGSGSFFVGIPVFKICINANQIFTFTNGSTTASTLNTNYKIVWGDGSTDFNATTWSTPLTHSYSVGLWNLVYTIQSSNGCPITKNYIVFVGSNPAVSLGNPGNTDICNSNPLTFPITGTTNNPPGTIYTVTFNDGSSAQIFNHPPPASVTHTFNISSCGVSSSNGTTTFQNSFSANIVAENPCGASAVGVVPIYVSTPPIANFTLPTTSCINTSVCITNTSIGAYENNGSSSSCNTSPKFIWSISPSTGFTISSGSLGNDFGSTDPSLWTTGTSPLCLNFTQAGTYSITIKIGNRCGIDTKIKTICIESPLVPLFSVNTNSGCIPLSITTNNTTSPTNQCTIPINTWSVSYAAANCGTSITSIPNQTTTNASYNFTEAGTYTITLKATNSCSPPQTTTQVINVKKPPTISALNGVLTNYCGPTNINPVANVTNCAPSGSILTYAWSFPGGTPATASTAIPGTIAYPAGGPYTVSLVVSNECGPSTTATQTFTVNTAPVITNTTLAQTICSGASTTAVALTALPIATTFSWTATATTGITGYIASGTTATIPTQTISTTASSPGTVTYTITPTIGTCVGTPVSYVITVNPAPTITTQPASSSVCIGGTPTLLSVVLNSASVTPTYQWYSNTTNSTSGGTLIPSATNPTYNPPATATGTIYYYCMMSLASGGCSSLISAIATVTVNPLPTITTQPLPTQSICEGGTIAALTAIYTGGLGTPSYQWYSNTANATSGGIPVGTNASTYSPPTFNTAGTYYYYVVISLSGNSCGSATSNTAEIIVVSDPIITTQPLATQTVCQNTTASALVVAVSGGIGTYTYQWYSNSTASTASGSIIAGATSPSYTPTTTVVGTKYYYCIISQTAVGCSVTSNITTVIVNASPTIQNQPIASIVCVGGTPTALSVTFSNGIGTPNYQWYSNTTNANVGGTLITGATNSTLNPPATSVGVIYYYCTLSFPALTGSCATITSNTAAITINAGSSISQQPLPNQSLCVGTGLSSPLTVSYSGGTGTASYQWYYSTTINTTGGTPVGTNNPTYTPPVYSTAGTYYYYVILSFSGSGCGAITSTIAQVDVINNPVVTTQPLTSQIVCQTTPASPLTVAVSGGIGTTYFYQWYSSTTNSTTNGVMLTGETNSTYTPPTVIAGTLYYYCIITQGSATGCTVTSNTATVTVNLAPAFTTQPIASTICLGEIPTALSVAFTNGAGVANFQWFTNTTGLNTSGTLIVGATNATYNPIVTVPGTNYYYCVITFPSLSGGCATITSNPAEINVNPYPVVASESTTICSSTSFTVNPASTATNTIPTGTTYTWTNPTISPAGAVTGASAVTTPQNNISQTLLNTTTSPATVTYTVTPVAGVCAGTAFSVTVTVNPAINPNIVAINNACFGVNNASITTAITGGIPFGTGAPYVINWTGPNGFNATSTSITGIAPGSYTITIADAGGCPFTNSYTITEPADIVITTDIQNQITCFGSANGNIGVSVTGGTGNYAYNWTYNTAPFAITEDIDNLAPGNYGLTVSDANNCGPKIALFTITQPPLLVVSLVSQTNILCYGAATGAITISAVGGVPVTTSSGTTDYLYAWTGPNGFTSTSQNLTNLFAGTYNVTVTDNNGCVKNLTVIVTQTPDIIISYTTTPITCYGANNASMTVTISGGIGPYQYQWSNLATTLYQTNLSAGNYTITVTDHLGCVKVATINIPQAPVFMINPIVTNISCFGAHDGSINLNLTGGIPTVSLVWSDGSTSGLIRNNLGPGTYTATISDGTPCYIVRTFTILEPQLLVLAANVTNALDCNNANTGAINLLVSGGTPPFSYLWNNGTTTEDLSNIPAGNYMVTVTDARGCVKSAQYSVTRPNPLMLNVNTTTTANCNTHEVIQNFTALPTGGVPPYQLTWSSGTISGANHEYMTTTQNGLVAVTATDAIGCTTNFSLNVTIPVLGNPSFTPSSIGLSSYGIFAILDPIQFNSTITGDYTSVVWDFGDGTFSNEINPIHTYLIPNDYYLVTQTVTYPFGCVYVMHLAIKVEVGYLLVVPTAFTPNNNDGINDTFRPVTKGLKNVHLDVYDTWGSLIYSEVGDVIVGWNGKIKGISVENGNYYAKVSGETFYGTVVNENQTFVLIK